LAQRLATLDQRALEWETIDREIERRAMELERQG
jgi:hypothetical protein